MRMIDADIHVSEPVAVWDYVDREFRDRIQITQVIDDPDWQDVVYDARIDGHPIPELVSVDRAARQRGLVEFLKSRNRPPGFGARAERYIADIDLMGLDQVVIYPSLFLFASWMTRIGARFAAALARAYNDWIYDFCAIDRKRMRPVALMPLHSVEASIAEARRCHDRGFVAAFIRPNPLYGRTVGHPDYHPLYRVLEELNMTLGIHEGGITGVPILGRDRTDTQWGVHAMSHPFEQMAAMISMIEHKVFDAFPKLRVLFLEAGSSLWVPFWLERLDEELELTYRISNGPKLLATDYFNRQCFATFEASDPYVSTSVELIGDRTLMMTSDYPHPESSYTETREKLMNKGLTDEALDRVCYQNAKAAYPLL